MALICLYFITREVGPFSFLVYCLFLLSMCFFTDIIFCKYLIPLFIFLFFFLFLYLFMNSPKALVNSSQFHLEFVLALPGQCVQNQRVFLFHMECFPSFVLQVLPSGSSFNASWLVLFLSSKVICLWTFSTVINNKSCYKVLVFASIPTDVLSTPGDQPSDNS